MKSKLYTLSTPVILGEMLSGDFLASAMPARTKPQLATGPQKCVVKIPASEFAHVLILENRLTLDLEAMIVELWCSLGHRMGSYIFAAYGWALRKSGVLRNANTLKYWELEGVQDYGRIKASWKKLMRIFQNVWV